MKKLALSTLVIACSVAVSACSSSSSNGGSNKVDKTEYTQLQSEVTSLRKSVSELQTELSQSKSTSQATIAQLQANLEKAIAAAASTGDETSKKALEDLKNQLNQAQKDADKAAENAQKAQAEADKAKADADKAQAEADKAQAEADKAKASEQAKSDRTPISDKLFGGASGEMVNEAGKLAGGILIKSADKTITASKPESIEGVNYLTVLDKTGKLVHVGIDSSYDYKQYLGTRDEMTWSWTAVDARYGVYNDSVYNPGAQYVYVQGNATPVSQIPTSGTVTYSGNVAHVVTQGSYPVTTKGYAEINFADKTAHLELNTEKATKYTSKDAPALTFDGKVTANSIAAVANENNAVKMQAGFFGDDAKHLAGIYDYQVKDNKTTQYADGQDKFFQKDFQGVFGLTKSE